MPAEQVYPGSLEGFMVVFGATLLALLVWVPIVNALLKKAGVQGF